MKDLTIDQIKELHILLIASKVEILESVDGVARVAKKVQLYLDCSFSEAVSILGTLINEFSC